MKRNKRPPEPEYDPGLGCGAAGFVFGKMIRAPKGSYHHVLDSFEVFSRAHCFDRDASDQLNKPNYLHVTLSYRYDYSHLKWVIVLAMSDGDDGSASRWTDLTRDNWIEAVQVYDDLCIPEAMSYYELAKFGFEF